MKKILICAAMFFSLSASAIPTTINETVIKRFKELFPEAQSTRWYEGDTYYQVSFEDKGVICKVFYDLDGKITSTYRYYDEKKLCPFIASRIKEKYSNKSIKGITEIHDDSGLVYQIILQDEKNWYVINCDEAGNMAVKNKFKKA
ncbi:MAG TPA: hypothetical protein VGW31_06420 [Hanamia sp.]|nr:hypothetical protein [Hanamia sp.]